MTETIDVWRIRSHRRESDISVFRDILPKEEIARAERFRDEAKRKEAVSTRGIQRLILADYTRIPANELVLVTGTNGKPHLEPSQNEKNISFNFSGSGDISLFAVSWGGDVGVDVEKIRSVERAGEIARRRLTREDAREIEELIGDDRDRVFLQRWVRHEALLKARSGTIWNPSGAVCNLTDSGSMPYVQDEPDFTVRDVESDNDYVAAVAARGEGWQVSIRDYTD